jgi:hypothetical protein
MRSRVVIDSESLTQVCTLGSTTISLDSVRGLTWLYKNKKLRIDAGPQSTSVVFANYANSQELRDTLRDLFPHQIQEGWMTAKQCRKPPAPWVCYLASVFLSGCAAISFSDWWMRGGTGLVVGVVVSLLAAGYLSLARNQDKPPFGIWGRQNNDQQV